MKQMKQMKQTILTVLLITLFTACSTEETMCNIAVETYRIETDFNGIVKDSILIDEQFIKADTPSGVYQEKCGTNRWHDVKNSGGTTDEGNPFYITKHYFSR